MSRIYDLWGKLVGAVLRKEKDRKLAYYDSFSTRCSSDLGSPFSLDLGLRDAASTGGDVENQKASDPPPDKGKQTAPPSSEEEPPTSQKESSEDQDKDKRKKSSDQGVIKMLQGMKATLLRLNNLEHDNAKERPTTSSAIDADKQSDLLDEEEEEEEDVESTAEQKKSEGDNLPLQKSNEGRKQTKKNVSNRSANAQLQQSKPKRPSVNMASAAQKKMVKPLVNDLTKSGDDKSDGQEAVPDDGGDGGAADIEDEQSQQLEEGQALGGITDSLEGLMDDPLWLSGLGLENWNDAKRLVVEISGLLQQFMKNNKGRRRQTDTAKQPDIDDDEPEEPGEVTGEGSMEENESPQPEFEAEEKSPVKDEEANNEPDNTMSNVFSTPVSKTMKPGKRGPNRLAQAPLQRAGAEKKPMSSIADVVKSSGDESKMAKIDDDAREEDQRLLQEENVNNDDDGGEEDQEEETVIGDDVGEKEQDFLQESKQGEEMVNNDNDIREEDQNFLQKSEQEQEMVNDGVGKEEANVVQESEQKQKQKVGDESGEIREEILTRAAGNVGRNIKAGKLDSHQSVKTQLKQGKGKGSININAVMESGVFEQQQELEQEGKTEESSSLQDYENVLGLDESLAMRKAPVGYGSGNDGPKRPVKVGKSDLNRSAKTQSHLAESMRQKMSYDPQVILEHKEDFIDEDAMEELQDPEQETEEDENEGMRAADFESLLKGNETRGVSKNTKAGKRDSSGLAALNAAMGSGVLEQQEEMVIGDRSVEDYQIDYKSLLKAGDELKSETAVGKKRVSPKPQLKQPKSTMSSVATPIGVFGKQEMVAAVKESGEFLEQDMVNDVGVGVGVDVEEEDQNLVQEYKNSERQVMIRNKKRAVAPTKKSLSKPQLQLQAKPNRPSIESGAFAEQIDQEILPDDGGDGIGDADEEAEEEEEEEENVSTEELSQSTSV